MKIALTVWGNRISPVFDASDTLLVAEIKNKQIIKKYYQQFDPVYMIFLDHFKNSGGSFLVCGAISKAAEERIIQTGIKLLAFITGNSDEILNLYLNSKRIPNSFFMPGTARLEKWSHTACAGCLS